MRRVFDFVVNKLHHTPETAHHHQLHKTPDTKPFQRVDIFLAPNLYKMQRVTVLLWWGEWCLYCTFLLYYKLHSLTHTHALFFPITKHCSEDSSGFSIVPEDIFTCQLEQPGINLPTFQLVDNPLYLLSHSCLCVYL